MSEHGGTPPPGWYPDGEGWERRWDGTAWTEDRRQAGGAAGQNPMRPAGDPGLPPSAAATHLAGAGGPPAGQPPAGPPPGYGPPSGSPYDQGGMGGFGVPGGPGGPAGLGGFPPQPPQPQQKKKLLPLIIAAAAVLVLLIGGGIVFAVTQLGGDDTKGEDSAEGKGNDGDDGDKGGGDDEGDKGGGDDDDVDPGVTARSDFDGDGNGDVAGIFFDGDDFDFVTLSSDGSGKFDVQQERGESESMLWEDWDGDGTGTALLYSFESYEGELKLEGVDSSTWDEETHDFEIWDETYQVRVDSGDFDGDGTPDLAVLGQTADYAVTVWVLKGNGDSFEKPAEWATVKATTMGATYIFPGDWDGDGTDDLLTTMPTEDIPKADRRSGYYSGESGVSLLKSTGDSFEQDGEIGELPIDGFSTFTKYTIGDFRGDGTPLMALTDFSDDIVVLEYSDGDLTETSDLEADYDGYPRGITASDVNGDGKSDIIAGRPDGEDASEAETMVFEVLLSEGDAFAEAEEWASIECGDSCGIYFDGAGI